MAQGDDDSDAAFAAAKQTLCCLHKDSDIAEVQAVIALLMPSLDAYWKRIVNDAITEIETQLDALDDNLATPSVDALAVADPRKRDRLREDLVMALLLALERRAAQPVSLAGTQLLSRAARTLLADGAASMGETLDLTRAPLLPQAAQEDLLTLIRGRVSLRREALSDLLRAFLTNRSVRRASASSLIDVAQQAATGGPVGRAAWKAALLHELGSDTATWLPFTVDQWAYRWFNIGGFTAAQQAGILGLVAVAILDNLTSPFCRWVNGRVISMERAQRQIDRHVQAALAGDVKRLMENWPLLTFTAKDGPPEFAIAFARVGLPPYHGHCRTRVRIARFRSLR